MTDTPKTPVTASSTSNRKVEVSSEDFFHVVEIVTEKFSRDQQLRLVKMISGLNGATVSFPGAREGALRKELVKATQLGTKPGTNVKAKAENVAMKGSMEEKSLHTAQAALRAERLRLGLAKNDSTSPDLESFVSAVKAANAAFQAKKSAYKH